MKAITVEPKMEGSALLEGVAEPDEREASVLVEVIRCRTGWHGPVGVGETLPSHRDVRDMNAW